MTQPFIRIDPPRREPAGDFNFARKIYHTFGLIIPLALYFDVFGWLAPERPYLTREVAIGALIFAIAGMFVVDSLRFTNADLNRLFMRILGPLLKEEESGRYNATIPYFLACLILMLLCSDLVVCFACIYLMIGDPWAAYVGGHHGRIRFWNGKSLEGLLAFIVAGFLACLLFLLVHQAMAGPGHPFALWSAGDNLRCIVLGVIFVGVVFAATAEFFSVIALRGLFDDNLVVPLSGALGIILAAAFAPELANALYFPTAELFASN